MRFKQVMTTILISGVTAFASVFVYSKYMAPRTPGVYQNGSDAIPVNYTSYIPNAMNGDSNNATFDFTYASKVAVPGVVHIKTLTNARKVSNNLQQQRQRSWFDELFGDEEQDYNGGGRRQYVIPGQRASGSGVLISNDGYIVTNNHVVDNADTIRVTLNDNKTYGAKVIGTDPYTDLAVIKVEAKGLPYLLYGNSDDVQVGQWVLAVGYPLNLETTVTAGIVSAKGRNIGINRVGTSNISPIESFIQTDAAVNQGNSGGALINTSGELVGINSAIASPTGSYAGYSYAIPVNLVRKVVDDIMKYGNVQRAFLGLTYIDPARLNDAQLSELNITRETNGVSVQDVTANGAAANAGLRKGDVLTKINGVTTPTGSAMNEQLARYKPGDKVSITYLRGNKEYTANAVLKNREGTTDIVKDYVIDRLGADLYTVPARQAQQVGLNGGVLVSKISSGILRNQTSMRPGFIILKANSKQINTIEELQSALQPGGKVRLEGIYANGGNSVYYYDINTNQGN
ncbi:Do/DeqQ family serine protease [Chitinophaga skermanii]|uniref:Do/DeqQ family serine protease n=1 Tax=Chitinophaga skermanii TaxID=331697 RepID=A0A327QPG1_9BACT|nr:trypsin-like peptidase domain-containing protein [Chitinophaga skermanii]RAJ05233.1 Do/DeqQ family serine protease [Chitinophaga skermanii]